MRRGAGIALTAAALSITLGVLIGVVVILGNKARSQTQSDPGTVPVVSSAAVSSAVSSEVVSSALVLSAEVSSSQSSPFPTSGDPTSGPTSVSVAAVSSAFASARPVPRTTPPGTARSTPATTITRPAIAFSTVQMPAPTTSTPTPTTSTSTPKTSTSTTAVTTSTTARRPTPAPPAGPVAGGRCAALGEKATVAGGSTVFCQTDFATGRLAWRAVVNGGGCLSKKMTGIGVDGFRYVCRPDRNGLDHWRRA